MTTRNRRSRIEDLWQETICNEDRKPHKVPSVRDGRGKRWRARYVDDVERERAQAFKRKTDARRGRPRFRPS